MLIRADAGPEIGTGHVMRSLALAQAWQDAGGRAVLVAAELPPALAERLHGEGLTVLRLPVARASDADAGATLQMALAHAAAWVVLDGYAFDARYAAPFRRAGLRLLALDDMAHLPRYTADVLLNQNLSAHPSLYAGKVEPETALLLGTRYSLLRREFRAAPVNPAGRTGAKLRVLVSFGGGDAENISLAVLHNLARAASPELEIVVLAGAANPHVESLRAFAARAPFRCEVRTNVTNVAGVMAWADVAITAAGSTVWELAAMQLPALIGAQEDNQLAGLAALREVPFFRAWPVAELLARDLAAELATLAQVRASSTGFDVHGAVRVVDFLRRQSGPSANLLSA